MSRSCGHLEAPKGEWHGRCKNAASEKSEFLRCNVHFEYCNVFRTSWTRSICSSSIWNYVSMSARNVITAIFYPFLVGKALLRLYKWKGPECERNVCNDTKTSSFQYPLHRFQPVNIDNLQPELGVSLLPLLGRYNRVRIAHLHCIQFLTLHAGVGGSFSHREEHIWWFQINLLMFVRVQSEILVYLRFPEFCHLRLCSECDWFCVIQCVLLS